MKNILKSHKYYDIYEVEDHLKKLGWSSKEIEIFKDSLHPGCNGDLCHFFSEEEEDEEDNWEEDILNIRKKWRASGLPKNPEISYWW